MKKLKEELKYGKKGITLISLVVTIIVLLILAGVTIATLTGNNGILTRASESKEKTEEAGDMEKIGLAISAAQIGENGYQKLNETNFKEALENEFAGRNLQLTNNEDGSYIIDLDNMNKTYYVDMDGQIISNKNILKISTLEDLKTFRNNVNSGNTYEGWYIFLTNDITLNENEQWEPIGLYINEATSPDDSRNTYFSGIFDGKNHYIKGVNINTTNKVQGLFGLNLGGTIKNLQVLDCNITGGIATGGIVGYNYNNSKIYNCSVSGVITCVGTQMAGGISGNNTEKSIIEKCFNLSSISGPTLIGGITGYQSNGSIVNSCFNEGTIESTNTVGGIVGRNNGENVLIKNCYNKGNIKGTVRNIGGIIGKNDTGTVKNTYNIGTIENADATAIGQIVGSNANNGKVLNSCYWKDEIEINGDGETVSGSTTDIKLLESKETSEILAIINDENRFIEDKDNINNGYPILK